MRSEGWQNCSVFDGPRSALSPGPWALGPQSVSEHAAQDAAAEMKLKDEIDRNWSRDSGEFILGAADTAVTWCGAGDL